MEFLKNVIAEWGHEKWARAFVISALVFFALISSPFFLMKPVIKALPIWLLWVPVWKSSLPPTPRWLLMGAILFASLGDIFLALPGDAFIFGLGSFLLAHLLWIILHSRQFQWSRERVLQAVCIFIYASALFALLAPGADARHMLFPTVVYGGVLACMAISACFANQPGTGLALGGVLFVISDSFIGYTRFVGPITGSSHLIMATYYASVFLLTTGNIKIHTHQ